MTDGIPGDDFQKPEDAQRPSGAPCYLPLGWAVLLRGQIVETCRTEDAAHGYAHKHGDYGKVPFKVGQLFFKEQNTLEYLKQIANIEARDRVE